MNTNQKTQLSSTTSTTNGQDRLVELTQGGCLFRRYKNYSFDTLTESHWDVNIAKEYCEIAKEFVDILSKNRVVRLAAYYKKKHMAKRSFWGKWTSPIFVEDGGVALLKKDLKNNKWGKQLWADYMWYEQRDVKTIFFQLPSQVRYYDRFICVLQENINFSIVNKMLESCNSDYSGFGIRIFPYEKIEHQQNEKETIHCYAQSDKFIAQVAFDLFEASIVIELNHNYMNYQQMLDIIEPLFEKRGIKIKDKTDPYIYHGFPTDYVEHNEYPCAGYQFFD